ncbi:MAG: HipA N-terminal domain-containing protein [Erysipelotrichaceae bacterium]
MNKNYRQGKVYVKDVLAGIIKETESGYSFTYCEEYLLMPEAVSVSLTLKLQNEPYLGTQIFPFFDGIIPEGWLMESTMRIWKLPREDRFGLLLVACKDPVGRVSIEEIE